MKTKKKCPKDFFWQFTSKIIDVRKSARKSYFYVNIPFSWLQYEEKERLGHMGNLEFLITAFKESVANAVGVSICLKELERTNIRGQRGDGCHIT